MAERVFMVFTDPQSAPRLMHSLKTKGFALRDSEVVEANGPSPRVALTIGVPGSRTGELYRTISQEAP